MHKQLPLLTGLVLTLTCLGAPTLANACSSFLLANAKHTLMAKSYDWHTKDGMLVVNKRKVKKSAFLPWRRSLKPLQWTSRYGNITFNQYGREFPLGGINEKGLAIEVLWLRSTQHPRPQKARPSVNELQWIQYLLDTAANTQQAIQKTQKLQIVRSYAKVHYLMCDKQGVCATVEHVGGKQVIHHGKQLPIPVLTNNTYTRSVQHLRRHKGFGGKASIPQGAYSLSRYCRAASLVRTSHKTQATVARAFQILNNVRMGNYSKWQIVYDLKQRRIHFRNAGETKVTTVSLDKHKFCCRTPVQVMDLQGTITTHKKPRWTAYTTAINQRLIRRTFRQLGARFPPAMLDGLAQLPSTMRCTAPPK